MSRRTFSEEELKTLIAQMIDEALYPPYDPPVPLPPPEIQVLYPYTDYTKTERYDLISHYIDTQNGRYIMLQKETGRYYASAVDKYPCKYTYEVVEDPAWQ